MLTYYGQIFSYEHFTQSHTLVPKSIRNPSLQPILESLCKRLQYSNIFSDAGQSSCISGKYQNLTLLLPCRPYRPALKGSTGATLVIATGMRSRELLEFPEACCCRSRVYVLSSTLSMPLYGSQLAFSIPPVLVEDSWSNLQFSFNGPFATFKNLKHICNVGYKFQVLVVTE